MYLPIADGRFEDGNEFSRLVAARLLCFPVKVGAARRSFVLLSLAEIQRVRLLCFFMQCILGTKQCPFVSQWQGVYTLKLFKEGAWRYLHVDDRLPCSPSRTPHYCCSQDPNQARRLLT